MSSNPQQDPGSQTGPEKEREQPPVTHPIPDETDMPDEDEPERDREPGSSGDESEDKPVRP